MNKNSILFQPTPIFGLQTAFFSIKARPANLPQLWVLITDLRAIKFHQDDFEKSSPRNFQLITIIFHLNTHSLKNRILPAAVFMLKTCTTGKRNDF